VCDRSAGLTPTDRGPIVRWTWRRLGAGVAGLGLALSVLGLLGRQEAVAQRGELIMRPAGVLDDVKSVKDFCDPKRLAGLLGPPVEDAEDVDAPVHGVAFQFIVTSGAPNTKESFYIAIFSYMNLEALANQTTMLLAQLGIPPEKARLTNYERCAPLFTSVAGKSSKAHQPLLAMVKRQTLLGESVQIIPVAALYLSHSGALAGLLVPPKDAAPPKADAPPAVVTPKPDTPPSVPPKTDAAPPPKSDTLPSKPVIIPVKPIR